MEPNTVHDEIQFDKDSTERKKTAHQNGRNGTKVEGLIRDLARDLVGSDGMLDSRLAETKVGSDDTERQRDQSPECQNSNHTTEWNSTRRVGSDQEEVESKELTKNDTREQHGGQSNVSLPCFTSVHLVYSSRNKAGNASENHEEDDHNGSQGTTVRWGKETKDSKDCR